MLAITKRLASKRVFQRGISATRVRQTTVGNMLPSTGAVPTVDHNMSVERAAQLMAEHHIDAVPVTKDDKVIGLFTERDYFDKVLNGRHQATRSSMVCEVGIIGPELIIARPDDTVEDCLAVMTRKNMISLPVVEQDGHAIGTISVMDLTRQYMEDLAADQEVVQFSEPSFFPEDLVLPDGGVHDEDLGDPQLLAQLAMDPTDAILEHSDSKLEERAAELFCEGSVFPEYTPAEEVLLAETHQELHSSTDLLNQHHFVEHEERLAAAQAEVLSRIEKFSEPSDFPEAAPVDEAMFVRAQ